MCHSRKPVAHGFWRLISGKRNCSLCFCVLVLPKLSLRSKRTKMCIFDYFSSLNTQILKRWKSKWVMNGATKSFVALPKFNDKINETSTKKAAPSQRIAKTFITKALRFVLSNFRNCVLCFLFRSRYADILLRAKAQCNITKRAIWEQEVKAAHVYSSSGQMCKQKNNIKSGFVLTTKVSLV